MTAVAPVVVNGNGVWVGWPGIHLEDPKEPIPESDPNDHTPTAGLKSDKVVTFIFYIICLLKKIDVAKRLKSVIRNISTTKIKLI